LGVPIPNASLTGSVRYDGQTGNFISFSSLYNRWSYNIGPSHIKRTNASGNYTIIADGLALLAEKELYGQAARSDCAGVPGGDFNGCDITLPGEAFVKGRLLFSDMVTPVQEWAVNFYPGTSLARFFRQALTDSNGYFSTLLATGTYTAVPFGKLEHPTATTPPSFFFTVTPADQGQSLFISTFVVSAQSHALYGKITAGGKPVTAGAVVVLHPNWTYLGKPINWAAGSELTGWSLMGFFVKGNSKDSHKNWATALVKEDGTYRLEVSEPGRYNLRAFYTRMVNDNPLVTTKSSIVDILGGSDVELDIAF
jgi:hypothetical protein